MSEDATDPKDKQETTVKHDGNTPECSCGHCGPSSDVAVKLLDALKAYHEQHSVERSDADKMSIDLDAASKLLAALIAECNGNVSVIIARLLWRTDIANEKRFQREQRQFVEFMKSAQFVGEITLAEDDEDKKPVTVN